MASTPANTFDLENASLSSTKTQAESLILSFVWPRKCNKSKYHTVVNLDSPGAILYSVLLEHAKSLHSTREKY